MGIDNTNNEVMVYDTNDGEWKLIGRIRSVELNPEPEEEKRLDEMELASRVLKGEFVINLDMCCRRLLSTIINPKLGNNNWRKMHHYPMWRK